MKVIIIRVGVKSISPYNNIMDCLSAVLLLYCHLVSSPQRLSTGGWTVLTYSWLEWLPLRLGLNVCLSGVRARASERWAHPPCQQGQVWESGHLYNIAILSPLTIVTDGDLGVSIYTVLYYLDFAIFFKYIVSILEKIIISIQR